MDLEPVFRNYNKTISATSVKYYTQNMLRLNQRITGEKTIKDLTFLNDVDEVMKKLEPFGMHTQKNYLVPIQVLLTPKEGVTNELYNKYADKVKELRLKIEGKYDENTKTQKQDVNWIEHKEVLKLLSKLKKQSKPVIERDPDEWNYLLSEIDLVQQYLVWYLYSGKAFEPLRNDFARMKVTKDFNDTDEGNWLVMSKMPTIVLNEYKTANKKKNKGDEHKIKIVIKDMALRKLLTFWLDKMNKTPYLLVNPTKLIDYKEGGSEDYVMNENGLTKYLNKISKKHLGKTISSSLLRSIYITEKYKGLKTMKEKKELADKMGHTAMTAMTMYNKVE